MAVEVRRQKSLALIRAREMATNLSIPVTVFDPDGTIVFFNRAAEGMLGATFEEAGELPVSEWMELFAPRRPDGTSMPFEETTVCIALKQRKPAHHTSDITAADGSVRKISATAFPLMGREQELFGAFAIFWST